MQSYQQMKTNGHKLRLPVHPPTRLPIWVIVFAIICSTALLSQAATNELTTLLQKGLFEEEANHNLEAATQAYQTVITQFDKDRKLAATAVFRLGEVFRKQGKTNEAKAQYERVLREFPDQEKLAALSRKLVSTSSWTPPAQPDQNSFKIMNEARTDAAAGRYADALAKHVWYFENGPDGTRAFALNDWVALAAIYPPALQKLKAIRDEIERRFREGEAWRDPFGPFAEFSSLNGVLQESHKTKDLFLWLHKDRPSAAKTVYPLVEPLLIEAKEFALCGEYIGASSFDSAVRIYQVSKSNYPSGNLAEHNENYFRQKAGTLVALLVLNKRMAEADQVIGKALKAVDDPDFKAMLENARKGEFPPPKYVVPAALQGPAPIRVIPTRDLRVPPSVAVSQAPSGLIVVDDKDAEFQGLWTAGNPELTAEQFGKMYFWTMSGKSEPTSTVIFRPTIPALANYYVEVWHSSGPNRSTSTQWEVVAAGGTNRFSVNQRINGGQWVRLSRYPFTFSRGKDGYVKLSNITGATENTGSFGGVVIADAVRFLPVEADVAETALPTLDPSTLASLRAEAQAELFKCETLLADLKKVEKQALPQVLSTVLTEPDSNLMELLKAKSLAEQKLTEKRSEFAEGHPEVRQAAALVTAVSSQLVEKAEGIMLGLQRRVSTAKSRLARLDAQGSGAPPASRGEDGPK
ncbi:MAG: tetratricopeptide repeat protein [Verrucomicrobia bacterium]|nr:tetratricopeptide repeat protein [Verrucomicrobiota bacterium]